MSSLGLTLEMPGTRWCCVLSVVWVGRASVVFDLDSSPQFQLLIHDLLLIFYNYVWDQIGSEKLWEESLWLVVKKDIFNCKFIFTFHGCMEPTCTATCFIHFVLSHHSDNIWLTLSFFNWNVCLLDFLLWCFYLFIHFPGEQVWNVFVKSEDGLVCLVLWHINLCRLFNAKSIFM